MSNPGLTKNPSAPQVDPAIIAKLRTIAVSLLAPERSAVEAFPAMQRRLHLGGD